MPGCFFLFYNYIVWIGHPFGGRYQSAVYENTFMIVSASYKTDIPTFYGDWFMNRLRIGYCKMANPYSKEIVRVALDRDSVDAFVFWTKNLGPFVPHLPEIRARQFPFVIQYAINNYPRSLEFSVVDAARAVEHVRRISAAFGPRVCVWRYDTIIFSSITPAKFHLHNFADLATRLSGAVDEVVVSFAHFYKKTLRNLEWAGKEFGFDWWDPDLTEKQKLLKQLVEMAASVGIQLTVCSQPAFLVPGASQARCVDARRLSDVAGQTIPARLKGNRKECGCYHSVDIGEYDTCPHGCVYCYAVQGRDLAQARYRKHDPESEFLFTPPLPPAKSSAGTPADRRACGS